MLSLGVSASDKRSLEFNNSIVHASPSSKTIFVQAVKEKVVDVLSNPKSQKQKVSVVKPPPFQSFSKSILI